jgi:hypothetical protein
VGSADGLWILSDPRVRNLSVNRRACLVVGLSASACCAVVFSACLGETSRVQDQEPPGSGTEAESSGALGSTTAHMSPGPAGSVDSGADSDTTSPSCPEFSGTGSTSCFECAEDACQGQLDALRNTCPEFLRCWLSACACDDGSCGDMCVCSRGCLSGDSSPCADLLLEWTSCVTETCKDACE